ncbi:hypothetical protein CONLIGDRAFT_308461 [Coniochaeta ligniaria NRRL 30616]|uniref:Uncharacterized protein n=1 Tax=Coniochaeta ligniaria NRRL 30616 TaxID=1408157 RepID=A0A1J7JD63_9PEZI|nr:hypothetical protein CONLIGDRAFT_308461 [Coniochaeta ligniaria NRRL 30616]
MRCWAECGPGLASLTSLPHSEITNVHHQPPSSRNVIFHARTRCGRKARRGLFLEPASRPFSALGMARSSLKLPCCPPCRSGARCHSVTACHPDEARGQQHRNGCSCFPVVSRIRWRASLPSQTDLVSFVAESTSICLFSQLAISSLLASYSLSMVYCHSAYSTRINVRKD